MPLRRRSWGRQDRTATTRKRTTNYALAGLLQSGAGRVAGRASSGAHKHHGGVEVGVEGLGLILGPAPLTESALVNEGEGTNFVCHA
jgi:hypothetical protein